MSRIPAAVILCVLSLAAVSAALAQTRGREGPGGSERRSTGSPDSSRPSLGRDSESWSDRTREPRERPEEPGEIRSSPPLSTDRPVEAIQSSPPPQYSAPPQYSPPRQYSPPASPPPSARTPGAWRAGEVTCSAAPSCPAAAGGYGNVCQSVARNFSSQGAAARGQHDVVRLCQQANAPERCGQGHANATGYRAAFGGGCSQQCANAVRCVSAAR